MVKLPSGHQIGDYVVAVFPPHALLNCKVESVKFKSNGAVYYDLSVIMKIPEWSKSKFAKLTDVHWSFVRKQGEEKEQRDFDLAFEKEILDQFVLRNPTSDESVLILHKMDFYKLKEGFIAQIWGGELTFFEKEPSFTAKKVTRDEVLLMVESFSL